jgi:hypothetical protein
MPVNWGIFEWLGDRSTYRADVNEFTKGEKSLHINSSDLNHAGVSQTVTLEPNTDYVFVNKVKAKNIVVEDGSYDGAGIFMIGENRILSASNFVGTTDQWKQSVSVFNSNDNTVVQVQPHIGYHASLAAGEAWFDDLLLVKKEYLTDPGTAISSPQFELVKDDISVYCIRNSLIINNPNGEKEAYIYDLTGRLLKKVSIQKQKNVSVDISGVQSKILFVKIVGDRKSKGFKVCNY